LIGLLSKVKQFVYQLLGNTAQKSLAKGPEVTERASAANSPLKQGIRQLKALMFGGTGIKDHHRTRTETFNFADGVLAKPTPLV
jgi:hypothetical protein